jgi:NAD(P)-dependent dehydrogenase (short-subunit alcohol dehydrogenase family)
MAVDPQRSLRPQDGRVALVTGGSRGIGFSIARALVAEGAHVAITGRNAAHLEAARERLGGRTLAIASDLTRAEEAVRAVDGAAQQLGRLDILINNAGVGLFKQVADMSIDDWRSVIETNLSGVFYCTRAAIPHLRKAGGGFVVNISSLAGKNPFAGGAAYCASKAALNAFSEALMQEVRYDNIRVSYVMPGSVATEFGGRGEAGIADWKLSPDDVAQVVVDLLAHPGRSLPSRVELRPSRPPRK